VQNSAGYYNVYVASLSLANVDVSTSMDGGKSFTLNPVSASVPGDDREWIAADGASKVCVSYHDLATFNIDVNCSFDAGQTFTQLGDAIDPAHAYLLEDSVLKKPTSFSQIQASPVNHTGAVCEGGISCTGNRDLYDDFGVAVSPVTNAASIVYSDDQYDGFVNNPPPSGCTSSTDDSPPCDHTNAATGSSKLFAH
jgi:hypothetical protein